MREKFTNKFGASVVENVTQSLKNFGTEALSMEMLIAFLLVNDENLQDNIENSKEKVRKFHEDPENEIAKKMVSFFSSNEADQFFDIFFYEQHLSAMMYVRAIDNFTTYFKEILGEIVLSRPEILKSKETERLDFILSFDSQESLIKGIAEKKIEELFYKGIFDIEKYFLERLGIQIFKNDSDTDSINLLIKQRNLVVHNRGRISKEFVREFPNNSFEVGHTLKFEYEYISKINIFLNNYLIDLDIELEKKFGLELLEA